MSNRRMSKYGIASGFAFGYDPTGRSVFFYKIDRIQSFDIRYSLFDIRFFRVSFSICLAPPGQWRRLHEKDDSGNVAKKG